MRRPKPRHTNTIYDNARGDGWILTASGKMESVDGGHEIEVILYYTDQQRVETYSVTSRARSNGVDRLLRSNLDVGAKLGSYPGTKPEAWTDYEDQPRAVRMQRHATDIYDALGRARGLSETLAVRAAEEFGSKWSEKDADEWQERVRMVGEGRAQRITDEL